MVDVFCASALHLCDIFVLNWNDLCRTLKGMNSAENLAILRLARTAGIGPATYRKLLARHGSALAILAAAPAFLRDGQQIFSSDDAERELEKLHAQGGEMIVLGSPKYPSQLGELPDAPLVISVLGDIKFLHTRQLAMVGNRSASGSGMTWSEALAHTLASHGVTITSGLARGIDTAAHAGALEANGATVAVVAGGVDHIYPPENKTLRERIIEHGAVISEQAWGMAPTAQLFPRRNRVIAGLSVGIVVSEATRHSGSLITAQHALEYGREVYAVPGSPSDPRASGPNWLLKNGATLIENADDILASLPERAAPFVMPRASAQRDLFSTPAPSPASSIIVDDEAAHAPDGTPRQRIYSLLGRNPLDGDTLARQGDVTETDLNILLTDLELDGLAVREADGRWRRA